MQTEKAVLVRYGEVWLKSEPVRRQFERILVSNISALFPKSKVSAVPGRIWVHSARVPRQLSRVFGIVSFSPVIICDKDIDAIKAAAKPIVSKWKGTFAIRARRADKSFSLDSKQIEIAVAELVDLPVDLSDPKHELSVEIRDHAYIFERTLLGPGGLPLGTAGKVVARLRDDDDLLAVWLVMKRGALPLLVKPKPALLKRLQRWAVGRRLKSVKALREAVKKGAIALVDARSKRAMEEDLPVLNPLVGFSADEKSRLLKKVRG